MPPALHLAVAFCSSSRESRPEVSHVTLQNGGATSLPSTRFHLMIKPAGPACNLACRYCYYRDKQSLYPGSSFRMSEATLERVVRAHLDANPAAEVVFGWQGGEPLLVGLDFYQRAVALQARCAAPGQRVQNTLQTNGTMLTEEWCEFLQEHGFLVGLSLDGPRHCHDAYRRDQAGGPTFDRVMAAARLLRAHRVEFNILATVHAANADHPLEVYRFLRDEVGAQFLQFIPIVEAARDPSGRSPVTDRSVSGSQYGRFLIGVFDEWVRRDVGGVFVQAFDSALTSWLGGVSPLCVFAEECGRALVLEHNGDLYSCDHFVQPDCRLGNIMESPLAELVESGAQRGFGRAKRQSLPRLCQECRFLFACHGGCPKDRLLAAEGGEPPMNYLCRGYRSFFRHIDRPMRMMAGLLRQQRPAAEIMHMLASGSGPAARKAAPPRNAPCPCGSGRKYKHCHGRRDG